jgi:CRISPR-associated protein Csx3
MTTYNIVRGNRTVSGRPATLLTLSFGAPAQNDQIVKDAVASLEACKLEGGELVLLNGPASLPVACAIAHGVSHLFKAVAVFDPKMAGYVVGVSHDENRPIGTVVPAADVQS